MRELRVVVSDIDDEPAENIAEPIVKSKRRANVRGRAAFAESICIIHGAGDDGEPCSKFAHLPGNGRGPFKPNVMRQTRTFMVGLMKPLIIFVFVGLALFGMKTVLPRMFDIGNFVKSPVGNSSTVPPTVTPSAVLR